MATEKATAIVLRTTDWSESSRIATLWTRELGKVRALAKGGRVVGESDAKGAFPKMDPKSPQDVLATLYKHLGVDTTAQYLDNSGRPISVLASGKPIEELS